MRESEREREREKEFQDHELRAENPMQFQKSILNETERKRERCITTYLMHNLHYLEGLHSKCEREREREFQDHELRGKIHFQKIFIFKNLMKNC